MIIGSLFSGIGGLELGLEWAGLGPVLWQVEQSASCRGVLARHWPGADRSVTDVREAGRTTLNPVDILCGGFPCQDISSAGKGAGLAGERSGLWFEFARVIGELRPRWVVVENVASGAKRWVDAVMAGLEQLGYEALPLPVSAEDVGAPHLRKRIFIVARAARHAYSKGKSAITIDGQMARMCGDSNAANSKCNILREQQGGLSGSGRPRKAFAADARSNGSVASDPEREHGGQEGTPPNVSSEGLSRSNSGRTRGQPGATQRPWSADAMPEPAICRVDDGVPAGLVRAMQRRRNVELRALGNSVVPQCAEVVGWVIRELAQCYCLSDGPNQHKWRHHESPTTTTQQTERLYAEWLMPR